MPESEEDSSDGVERRTRVEGEKRKHRPKSKSKSSTRKGGSERAVTVSSSNQNWKWGGRKAGLAWPNGDQDGAESWCGSNAGW